MKPKDITAAVKGWADAALAYLKGKGTQLEPAKRRTVQLGLYIVIILLINLVSVTMNFRCDLTRNHTFSLSQRSRDIVSNLKENLKINVLFSRELPAQHTSIYRYLKELTRP